MNKTIAKITATLSASLMCALPMVNAFTANAENPFQYYGANQKHTYRAYVYVDADDPVYEFDYDLYFTGACENKMTFKSGKVLLGADSTRVEGLTQNRTIVRIDSEALNSFVGDAASLVYETSSWALTPADIANNTSRAVYAFNNYAQEHNIRQYYPTVSESFYLVGDANGDGVIRMNDHVTILQYACRATQGYKPECDVDGNGVINSYDALLVSKFLVRSINSFADYQA